MSEEIDNKPNAEQPSGSAPAEPAAEQAVPAQPAAEQPAAAQREIDRYCVYPGQACSFMVGATQIRAVRESVRQQHGQRFDVRDFHDRVLRSGPVPMDVLRAMV